MKIWLSLMFLLFTIVFLVCWITMLVRFWYYLLREKTFRVEYQVDTYDPTGSEMSSMRRHQDIVAGTPEEATIKVEQLLKIQSEREIQDLGWPCHEYSDFQAKKL